MEANGENRGKTGNLPMIKSQRDAQVVDLKLKGHTNKKIALATEMNPKTIGNILSKGGRLYRSLQSLRADKTEVLVAHTVSAQESLLSAKDPAIQELKRIALESPNDVARLKAIDMIIELTGIRDEDKPPLLDPNNIEHSLENFAKWINTKLLKTFKENAPKITFEYSQDTNTQNNINIVNEIPIERLRELIAEVKYMKAHMNDITDGEVKLSD